MTSNFASSVKCPQLVCANCHGDDVAALASTSAKTVRLAPCSSLIAQGWRGHQIAVAKTDADTLARIGLA